jgi:hydroxymethylpyrimidine/phosphomethylpyrimidine kinase
MSKPIAIEPVCRYQYPIVLSIAGSDSGGGAGIQADLKTISALGCFGTTAITAVTVQNTLGVSGIHPIPVEVVIAQIKAVMDDIQPHAIKIGMVHSAELAIGIADALSAYPTIPVIFDPVMVSTSGHHLIAKNTVDTLKKNLFVISDLLTPNLAEAAILADMQIKDVSDMKKAAYRIIQDGCASVLVKGGHLQGPDLFDVYLNKNGESHVFKSSAINSRNTHGTGCSLSSAIASYIALGVDLQRAIGLSKDYIQQAIAQGADVNTGAGQGPLNHFFDPQKLVKMNW